jgi:hypothetical protein
MRGWVTLEPDRWSHAEAALRVGSDIRIYHVP